MTRQHGPKLGSAIAAALQALALFSVARKVGPRRIGRVAALATTGYLMQLRRRVPRR